MAERLKDVKIVLADVHLDEAIGHVALAELGTIEFGKLNKDRLFH
jgi:hypothetical protein